MNCKDLLRALVFNGTGDRRFTQDSPILPDVWRAFAEAPAEAHDLLLTPHIKSSPGKLAAELRRRLEEGRSKDEKNPPDVAYNQFNVVARIRADELVRVVLPMTCWWHKVSGQVAKLQEILAEESRRRDLITRLDLEGRAGKSKRPGSSDAAIPEELAWLCQIVGVLIWAQKAALAKSPDKWEKVRAPKVEAVVESLETITRGIRLAGEGDKGEDGFWQVNRNRSAEVAITRSVLTVKADAVRKLFDIRCHDLTWAIVDSGVDASHPAFRDPTADPQSTWSETTRVVKSYDFTRVRFLLNPENLSPENRALPEALRRLLQEHPDLIEEFSNLQRHLKSGRRIDWSMLEPFLAIPHDADYETKGRPVNDHGTHVAGILGANADEAPGMCPEIRLYDLRVLDRNGLGGEFDVISALQFIGYLNAHRDYLMIHGANLSLSIRHEVESFACGATPVCEEAERLVSSGVVVVAAAGNQGFSKVQTDKGIRDAYQDLSITDPGNAEQVITVGATHRTSPHTYGVSYFSSRGPTGDGRVKPDLVAPGEKIEAPLLGGSWGRKDGTSMAAPHVSGAAALLMARHGELIGKPQRIKEILCDTATDLGRERYFQGHGLVDTLRALQSV